MSGLPLNDVSIRKMTLVPKIAFFGGTFDPIHQGHLEIAQKAVDKLGLERVIFFPCRRSPHKPDAPQAKDIDRLEMLKLAIENSPWAEVSD
ncbi:adenylyltransferase/cytidyltransferase family protein, partial [Akkermansiaceae bacterium]|nr:adenylyltransferase/cytidyltransferase family protein [Akkermansiaceae bacterium]